MTDKMPKCDAPAEAQNDLAAVIASWMREHQRVDYVPLSVRHGLARTILNAGYSTEADGRFAHITSEVTAEAERSIVKHGEQQNLPMGTGPDTTPLSARPVEVGSLHQSGLWPGMRARQLARIATLDTKSHSANEGGDDTCTWWHILREEVFEAAAEDNPAALRAELIQVAAVAVKMIDALDAKERP